MYCLNKNKHFKQYNNNVRLIKININIYQNKQIKWTTYLTNKDFLWGKMQFRDLQKSGIQSLVVSWSEIVKSTSNFLVHIVNVLQGRLNNDREYITLIFGILQSWAKKFQQNFRIWCLSMKFVPTYYFNLNLLYCAVTVAIIWGILAIIDGNTFYVTPTLRDIFTCSFSDLAVIFLVLLPDQWTGSQSHSRRCSRSRWLAPCDFRWGPNPPTARSPRRNPACRPSYPLDSTVLDPSLFRWVFLLFYSMTITSMLLQHDFKPKKTSNVDRVLISLILVSGKMNSFSLPCP